MQLFAHSHEQAAHHVLADEPVVWHVDIRGPVLRGDTKASELDEDRWGGLDKHLKDGGILGELGGENRAPDEELALQGFSAVLVRGYVEREDLLGKGGLEIGNHLGSNARRVLGNDPVCVLFVVNVFNCGLTLRPGVEDVHVHRAIDFELACRAFVERAKGLIGVLTRGICCSTAVHVLWKGGSVWPCESEWSIG